MYYYYHNHNGDIFENPENYDIDLLFYDSEKLIHIASGGLSLDKTFIVPNNYLSINSIIRLRRRFNIVQNNELTRENLTSIEDYFSFFNKMALRGFYSYDKVNIDDPNCFKFQLVSYPIYDRSIFLNNMILHQNPNFGIWNYDLQLLSKTKTDMPTDFNIFDLSNFI